MKKIQLPQSNIPDWAKDIPEDQWKEKIANIWDKASQHQYRTQINSIVEINFIFCDVI